MSYLPPCDSPALAWFNQHTGTFELERNQPRERIEKPINPPYSTSGSEASLPDPDGKEIPQGLEKVLCADYAARSP